MPQTTNINYTSNFTIDPYVYSLYFKAYGASGGGENVASTSSSPAGQVLGYQMRSSSIFVDQATRQISPSGSGGSFDGSGEWYSGNVGYRAGSLGWTSINDAPITETVTMIGNAGSGFQVNITYSPYQRALDVGTDDYQTQITINSVVSVGVGYPVGTVLSTSTWNNYPGTIDRILKVTNVSTTSFGSTPGGSGGQTTFLGFTLNGGQGGGVGGKNQGGNAGTVTQSSIWSTVSGQSIIIPPPAARGQLSSGGLGGLIDGSRNNGGNGSNGVASYTSSMTHVFDNASNVHNFSQSGSTSDISLNYRNPSAPDGIYGFTPSNGKYYELTFTTPYIDNNWTFSIPSNQICQQSAGGGTGAPTYGVNGTANKSSSGLDIWFQNGKGGNGYIRCFTINTSGVKVGAVGRGGGGASAVEGIFPRSSLVDSVTYAPGTTVLANIGAAGNRGGTIGNCTAGVSAEIYVSQTIYPQIYLSSNKLVLKPSDPTATLSWSSAGDIDAIRWPFNGDVTNGNLNSFALVSPTETTTYTAEGYNTSISDLVSFNPEASLTIVVLQAPVINKFIVTETLNFGATGQIEYEIKYADIGSEIEIYYSWDDGPKKDNTPELISTISIPACASAEETGDDSQTVVQSSDGGVIGPIPYTPSWDNWGPSEITYVITATGEGGISSSSTTTTVVIDRTPENMAIPETEDVLRDQEPVFTTPDADVLSQLLLVDDIDIPVEIKSNYPVEVQINDAGGFKKVRSL
tara:strand:+ start:868 stop:3096 length:2229 start_codon:yes stop_codon:yes gene_type:complete